MMSVDFTDVLIVGAGPVGLVTALGLAQQGIDTLLIEKKQLQVQEMYGRAAMLFPRTLELLEQVDVTEELTQAGSISRAMAAYKNGKRVTAKELHIRQKNSQAIFAAKYKTDCNKSVLYGWEIVDLQIDTTAGDGYNVTATVSHVSLGKRDIRCKYIVGADGGSSTVRQLANIDMIGHETSYRWARIDGKVKTDIPDTDMGNISIETEGFGSVFLMKLDGDAHRAGFTITPRLMEKYPDGPTQEQCVQEVIEAFKPFKLDFERVDWWTAYTVKQKVAAAMQKKDFIMLAGDAAHTHSSGFGQGMNTGVHDATNLVWKLAGTLKGWYKPEVVQTYDSERRPIAQKVVEIDKQASACMSGEVPDEYKHLGFTSQQAQLQITEANMSFNIGLSISYEPSVIVREVLAGSLMSGLRSPDALLKAPGPSIPIRLHNIIHKSRGRWNILVFTGHHLRTLERFKALRNKMTAEDSSFVKRSHMLKVSTIMIGAVNSTWDAFDGPALGRLYYDTEGLAHGSYGVSSGNGAIVVIRPDGVFAFAAGLHELDQVEDFFNGLCT